MFQAELDKKMLEEKVTVVMCADGDVTDSNIFTERKCMQTR